MVIIRFNKVVTDICKTRAVLAQPFFGENDNLLIDI
jgi:hypothetical protein